MVLTRHDTELVKTILTRSWETFCAISIVLCCLFPNIVWLTAVAIVLIWAFYRLYRRHPRRHSTCAAKGIFHGWFFRKQYYRSNPRAPLSEVPLDVVECHFHCHCLECGKDYEVKPPKLKSFAHRRPLFALW